MRTLALIARKGGSGNTALAVHLALAAWLGRRHVLIADADLVPLLGLTALSGDLQSTLQQRDAIAITVDLMRKLWGEISPADAVGQRIDARGGIYTVKAPDVNMCFPPLQWQTYDIKYTAAKYDAKGKKTADAEMIVVHNGVRIHTHVKIPKATTSHVTEEGPDHE